MVRIAIVAERKDAQGQADEGKAAEYRERPQALHESARGILDEKTRRELLRQADECEAIAAALVGKLPRDEGGSERRQIEAHEAARVPDSKTGKKTIYLLTIVAAAMFALPSPAGVVLTTFGAGISRGRPHMHRANSGINQGYDAVDGETNTMTPFETEMIADAVTRP
jgi:hypothetical protein